MALRLRICPRRPTTARRPKRRGHGRNGAQAYSGAAVVEVALTGPAAGQVCPQCEIGRVDAWPPRTIVKVTGQTPIGGTVYKLQQRLVYHQAHSGPPMRELRTWMQAPIEERRVEPNSSLGAALNYMLKRWDALTLFLRRAGAALDNNVCERALKRAIRHRKASLFYKTLNGAQVGDTFMSLIHTCELCGVNPFEYLQALLRHTQDVLARPTLWLPWNFHEQRTPRLALAA